MPLHLKVSAKFRLPPDAGARVQGFTFDSKYESHFLQYERHASA
jgi:hypothetical protein